MKKQVIFPICNHRPERAPKIFGHTFILCWRCTGVVIGSSILFLLYKGNMISFVSEILVISIIAMLPLICDGIAQYRYSQMSNNFRRFITGLLFGIGLAYAIGFMIKLRG